MTSARRDLRQQFMAVISDSSESRLAVQALRGVLRGASWGYWAAVQARKAFYRCGVFKTHRLPVPVISVGNLTCGGTGKTPLVQWIARFLTESGKRVAILSRGYKGTGQVSDESQAIQDVLKGVPHLLDADRVKTGRKAIEEDAQCIILDDAFQHLRLWRDLDIVTIDALNPFGFGYLLPRGLLREPLGALGRADVVVLTRTDQCARETVVSLRERVLRIKPSLLVAEAAHKPVRVVRWSNDEQLGVESLCGKKVLAFCGIGNPRAFALTLEGIGAKVVQKMEFADHHPYAGEDLADLKVQAARLGVEAAVTTRKDAVKISKEADLGVPLLVLDMVLEITQGKEAFERKVRETCGLTR